MKKLRFCLVAGLIFAISLMALGSPVYAGRKRPPRKKYYRPPYHRPYKYHRPRKRIRIRIDDRTMIIGGFIYLLGKAIEADCRKEKEVVYVSSPPVYVPAPQPTYTPVSPATIVTVKNSTNWYLSVEINGRQLSLYPGSVQPVSWTYTGRGHYVQVWAYLDPYHQELVGTYQGNLIGYQIPWKLNFDYGSFAIR